MKHLAKTAVLACLTMVLLCLPATVSASVTKSKTKDGIKAGETYYVVNKNISGNKTVSSYFQIEVKSSGTRYDLVFATGTPSSVRVGTRVAYGKSASTKSIASNAYVKSSSTSNVGYLLGVRVRSGSIKLTIYCTTSDGSFPLDLIRQSAEVLGSKTLAKGKQINIQMPTGNATYMPLIFGGTKGSKIKRTLSSDKYEVYTFGASYVKRVSYTNGKATNTVKFNYQTTYTKSNKTYLCTLIQIPPSSSQKASGWMKNTKGKIIFFYPKEYLGMKYTVK